MNLKILKFYAASFVGNYKVLFTSYDYHAFSITNNGFLVLLKSIIIYKVTNKCT